jgi:hypothetical protein
VEQARGITPAIRAVFKAYGSWGTIGEAELVVIPRIGDRLQEFRIPLNFDGTRTDSGTVRDVEWHDLLTEHPWVTIAVGERLSR